MVWVVAHHIDNQNNRNDEQLYNILQPIEALY
jgi:hypothetical protein